MEPMEKPRSSIAGGNGVEIVSPSLEGKLLGYSRGLWGRNIVHNRNIYAAPWAVEAMLGYIQHDNPSGSSFKNIYIEQEPSSLPVIIFVIYGYVKVKLTELDPKILGKNSTVKVTVWVCAFKVVRPDVARMKLLASQFHEPYVHLAFCRAPRYTVLVSAI